MKKLYIINITLIVLILILFIFLKIMSVEFAKIENQIVDKLDEPVITTYTTKNDIEKLYINNKKFLSELIYELNEIDKINEYKQISIPFNYPQKDLTFYSNKGYKANVSESLKNKFILLSSGLKINKMLIKIPYENDETVNNGNLNCDFEFLQSNLLSDTYISLMASSIDIDSNDASYVDIAFSFYDSGRARSIIKIGEYEGIYWYYCVYRNFDTRFYPFWHRVYDIVNGNLN